MALPALYERMYKHRVFTTADAADASGLHGPRLHEALSRLSSQGYFHPIRRGLYAVIPLESRGQTPSVNPYLVASKLADPYVMGYHTALELHGAAHSTYHQILVASPASFRGFTHQGMAYRHVSTTPEEVQLSRTIRTVEGKPVYVTDREWTLVQCARRLDLCGGLEELLSSLQAFPSIDLERIEQALRTIGHATLYNRVGYVLSHHRRLWGLTEQDLARIQAGTSAHRTYFGVEAGTAHRPGRAVLVAEWNTLVPDHLEGGEDGERST